MNTVKIHILISILAAGLLVAPVRADISIVHDKNGTTIATRVTLDDMMPHARLIKAVDPNFKNDGVMTYEGIDLKTLLSFADTGEIKGVTVVGKDQYVGYVPFEQIDSMDILLAWKMAGNPIGAINGGPLKIIFPDNEQPDPNCYTWYVDTLFVDAPGDHSLTVQSNDTSFFFSGSQLAKLAEPIEPALISKPAGCTNQVQFSMGAAMAVPLKKLLQKTAETPVNTVEFVPWVGKEIRLDAGLIESGIMVVFGNEGNVMHPVLGGAFSVMFPLEAHHSLQVPESGALFFLNRIIIN